jgi:Tol biopolymer transport system component/C-terminal processing protease CtpA/Prc
MNKLLTILFLGITSLQLEAQQQAHWVRYPSISPDGTQIAFSYKGDIYIVPVKGGTAQALTMHEAYDKNPVWSHDGKSIAFASDRYGNFDVFVMPVTGGNPLRLTHHSSADIPQDFTPDNQSVLFLSARGAGNKNIRFYSPRLFQNLYQVSVNGGRPILMSEAGMSTARLNASGDQIVFQDKKGYEDHYRKHHTSSVTRDIWTLDLKTNQYKKISTFSGEDLEPVFDPGNTGFYYLTESSGSLNIALNRNGQEQSVTNYNTHPVRNLSVSKNNTLCFTYNGDLFIQPANDRASAVLVLIQNDGRNNSEKNLSVSSGITQFVLSPNGKEIAFINRGEVFVTAVEGTQTKRITNTPAQERMVQWHPDGRSLIYATERKGSWDIYKSSIARTEEPYFFASTLLNEELVVATEEEEFQGKYSPDGKELAFISNRNVLKILNIESGQTRTILPEGRNYSYADGDWDFVWSPDSRYILSDDGEGNWFTSNVALISTDESKTIIHPFPSGYGQGNVKWAIGNKAMTWLSAKNGRRSHAYQGSRETDIFIGFFDNKAFERYILSKEEFALLEEKEKKEKEEMEKLKKEEKEAEEGTSKQKNKKDEKKVSDSLAFKLETDQFKERIRRVTINSCSISDYVVNPEGTKVYYLAAFEKGFDLWVTETRTKETKILAKLGAGGAGIQMSKDGKTLIVIKDGKLSKIDENGKIDPINVSGEMILNPAAERAYILEHAWRQVSDKFYDPKLHGLDWNMLYTNYKAFLPHVNNNYDFQDLLGEFLGELNASHTGGRYSPQSENGDETASLGLLFDETHTGKGLLVTEILQEGPFDKITTSLKPGFIIEKIDGIEITDDMDWTKLLNRKVGKNTLITFSDPETPAQLDEVVKPISFGAEGGLMYRRWISRMKSEVDRLSQGQIGYVHVQGMNDGSYRDVFDEVFGENYEKKALIVDTRFNGGGWLHDDLKTLLSGVRYLDFAPQGNRLKDGEPMGRWTKPSCVVMSEGNYSDAFIFPYVYKQAGIGKTLGKAVPGTGTAVWWETQIDPTMVFGIPMIATIGKENRPTENLQLEPDIEVDLKYADFLNGNDTQLMEAVQQLLKNLK